MPRRAPLVVVVSDQLDLVRVEFAAPDTGRQSEVRSIKGGAIRIILRGSVQ